MKNKERYKKKIKIISNELSEDFYPLVKKGSEKIFEIFKDFVNDTIEFIFNKQKKDKK